MDSSIEESNLKVYPPALSHVNDPTGDAVLVSLLPYRIWRPEKIIVVLGHSQRAEQELQIDALIEDSIPVYKRFGGGGAVVLGPHSLCIALRLSRQSEFEIQYYFDTCLGLIQKTLLHEYGVEAERKGISDLAVAGKKILGCSLYMPRGNVLFLASLMIYPCLDLLNRYLKFPSRVPDYRLGRSHADFTISLSEIWTKDQSFENTMAKSITDTESVPYSDFRLFESIDIPKWQIRLLENKDILDWSGKG